MQSRVVIRKNSIQTGSTAGTRCPAYVHPETRHLYLANLPSEPSAPAYSVLNCTRPGD